MSRRATPPGVVGGGSDLADGDRGGVTSCLVGRRREIGERRVRGVTGIDSDRVGVSAVQSFDERLGGECAAAVANTAIRAEGDDHAPEEVEEFRRFLDTASPEDFDPD